MDGAGQEAEVHSWRGRPWGALVLPKWSHRKMTSLASKSRGRSSFRSAGSAARSDFRSSRHPPWAGPVVLSAVAALAGFDGSQAASRPVISGSLTLASGRGLPIAGGVFCEAPDLHYFSAHSELSFGEHESSTCFVRLWVQWDNNAAVTPDLQARSGLLARTQLPRILLERGCLSLKLLGCKKQRST